MLLHMDQSTISRKISGKSDLTLDEAIKAVLAAGCPVDSICKHCKVRENCKKKKNLRNGDSVNSL